MIKEENIIAVNFSNKVPLKSKAHKPLRYHLTKNITMDIHAMLHKLGTYFIKDGKYYLSSRIINLAKAYKPKLSNYLIGLSYYYLAKSNEEKGNYASSQDYYKLAINHYQTALKYNSKNPSDFHLLLEIANIYLEMDDIMSFSKIYQKMILLKSTESASKVCRLSDYKRD